MTPEVEHGFIITTPDGKPWDEYLYPSRETAERIARLDRKLAVYPARRVFSPWRLSSSTVTSRAELIIDRGEA